MARVMQAYGHNRDVDCRVKLIRVEFEDMNHTVAVALAAIAASCLLSHPTRATEAGSDTVARIGAQAIYQRDLEARTSAKLEEKRKDFESQQRQLRLTYEREQNALKQKELQAILDERVLALESASKKRTAAELLKDLQVAPVTDKQIQDFFLANRALINESFGAAIPSIRDYLQKQQEAAAERAYLDSLRARYHAYPTLEPLREPVPTTGPRVGPTNAAVTIVEFSDFQCPYCARFESVLHDVLPKYSGSVALVYRNFPLNSLHPNAQLAAEAGVCAQEQGKFWEMHDAMFSEQSALDAESLKQTAQRLGMDSAAFNDCLTSDKARSAVNADAAIGTELGLSGTPSSFINGRFMNGALTPDVLSGIIEDELRRSSAKTAAR